MSVMSVESIHQVFDASIAAHQRFVADGAARIAQAAAAISNALGAGGKVLAFGNGGSASDAEHLIAELVGRFEIERRSLAGIALTANSSTVTAIGNDYGYDRVFERQVEGLGLAGDVAFGISTSGRSKNVELALATAKARGLLTIAMTGRDGGRMGAEADIHLNVADTSTPRIQEVHRTIMHALCAAIDASIVASPTP